MVRCKSHEDEAARNIIASTPTLKGVTVTLDALHSQKETADLIVKDKKGDFLLCVKKNTPKLYQSLKNLFDKPRTVPKKFCSKEKAHGRLEKRLIEVIDINPQKTSWPHTFKAARLTRKRDLIRKGQTVRSGSETVYLVSSHQGNTIGPKKLLEIARNHWAIENKLHFKKDRTMDEDRYNARNGVARIMSCIRSMAALILRLKKKSTTIIQRRLNLNLSSLIQICKCKSLSKWRLCFLK